MKPQDLLVVLYLASRSGAETILPYARLAKDLGLSQGEAHNAVRRAAHSGLLRGDGMEVDRAALYEFVVHGARYVFPAELGPVARGMPTAHAAAPIAASDESLAPLVWPSADGAIEGETLRPIYKSAPEAAASDPRLYELLALVDALRASPPRERELARKLFRDAMRGAGRPV